MKTILKNQRVGIYISGTEINPEFIEEQKKEIFNYINKNRKEKWYSKSKKNIYIDILKSRNDDRTEYNRMKEDIKENKLDIIIIWKIDRIFVNLKNIVQEIKFFEDKWVLLLTSNQDFDINTKFWKLIFQIFEFAVEMERNAIKERCALGRKSAAARRWI